MVRPIQYRWTYQGGSGTAFLASALGREPRWSEALLIIDRWNRQFNGTVRFELMERRGSNRSKGEVVIPPTTMKETTK